MDHEKGCCKPLCYALCMRVCLGLFTLIIILVIMFVSYIAFLQSGRPQVNIMRLSINNLHIDYNSQSIVGAISLEVRVSNKNERLMLLYEPLTVDVTKEKVQLGRTKIGGFSQMPQNDTNLDMTVTLDNARINKPGMDTIGFDMNNTYEMEFDVYLSGKIGLKVGGLNVSIVPFLSSCHQIKQKDVDNGKSPACEVNIFAFR
ncbi:Late embryogenesis abundant protein [Sesbania bispinosa]|nr:Late embryogenesis abundant protein [Sesbania bispinosa]